MFTDYINKEDWWYYKHYNRYHDYVMGIRVKTKNKTAADSIPYLDTFRNTLPYITNINGITYYNFNLYTTAW